MEHDWDKNCLIQTSTITKDILLNKKITASTPKAKMEYCPNCGNKIKDNATVCSICGINFNED